MRYLMIVLGFAIWACIEAANTVDAATEENCIKLTLEKEQVINNAIDKITQFLNEIQKKLDGIDIRLLRVDIDKHYDQEREEKDLKFKITVNDCGGDDDIVNKFGKRHKRHRKHHTDVFESQKTDNITTKFDQTTEISKVNENIDLTDDVKKSTVQDSNATVSKSDSMTNFVTVQSEHSSADGTISDTSQKGDKIAVEDVIVTESVTVNEESSSTTYNEESAVMEDVTRPRKNKHHHRRKHPRDNMAIYGVTLDTNDNSNKFIETEELKKDDSGTEIEDVTISNTRKHHHHKREYHGSAADSSAVKLALLGGSNDSENGNVGISNGYRNIVNKNKNSDEVFRNEESIKTVQAENSIISESTIIEDDHHHNDNRENDGQIDDSDLGRETTTFNGKSIIYENSIVKEDSATPVTNEEVVTPADGKTTIMDSDDTNLMTKRGHHNKIIHHRHSDGNEKDTSHINNDELIVASKSNLNSAVIEEIIDPTIINTEEIVIKYDENFDEKAAFDEIDILSPIKRKHHHKNKHSKSLNNDDKVIVIRSEDLDDSVVVYVIDDPLSYSKNIPVDDNYTAVLNNKTTTFKIDDSVRSKYDVPPKRHHKQHHKRNTHDLAEGGILIKERTHHHMRTHGSTSDGSNPSEDATPVVSNDSSNQIKEDKEIDNVFNGEESIAAAKNENILTSEVGETPVIEDVTFSKGRNHHYKRKHHRSTVDSSVAKVTSTDGSNSSEDGMPVVSNDNSNQFKEDKENDKVFNGEESITGSKNEDVIFSKTPVIERRSPSKGRKHHHRNHSRNNDNKYDNTHGDGEGDEVRDKPMKQHHPKRKNYMHFSLDDFKRYLEANQVTRNVFALTI